MINVGRSQHQDRPDPVHRGCSSSRYCSIAYELRISCSRTLVAQFSLVRTRMNWNAADRETRATTIEPRSARVDRRRIRGIFATRESKFLDSIRGDDYPGVALNYK